MTDLILVIMGSSLSAVSVIWRNLSKRRFQPCLLL